jgi:hypothetical protein
VEYRVHHEGVGRQLHTPERHPSFIEHFQSLEMLHKQAEQYSFGNAYKINGDRVPQIHRLKLYKKMRL